MNIEQNKATALEFLNMADRRQGEAALACLTEDCRIWIQGQGTIAPKLFVDLWGQSVETDIFDTTFLSVTADKERVCVEMLGDYTKASGSHYANTYVFIMRFRNEKICEIREYLDTVYMNQTFPEHAYIPGPVAMRPDADGKSRL